MIIRFTNIPGLVIIATVLQASSFLNIPNPTLTDNQPTAYGISVFHLFALIVVFLGFFRVLKRRKLVIRNNISLPLFLFLLYVCVACLGSVLLPLLFEGVSIYSLIHINGVSFPPTKLNLNINNYVQAINLVIILLVVISVIQLCETDKDLRNLFSGVIIGSMLVFL